MNRHFSNILIFVTILQVAGIIIFTADRTAAEPLDGDHNKGAPIATMQNEFRSATKSKRCGLAFKGDIPPQYDVVYPYVSDRRGKYIGELFDFSPAGRCQNRTRRHASPHFGNMRRWRNKLFVTIRTKRQKLVLNLRKNRKLHLKAPFVEFVDYEGRTKQRLKHVLSCHYVGRVQRQANTAVALSNCNGLSGLMRTQAGDYLIEPYYDVTRGNSSQLPHIVYRVRTAFTWKNVSILGDSFYDKKDGRRAKKDLLEIENNLDDEFYVMPSTKLHMETLIAADHTVVKFHGAENTAQYIMTLMNIVNTIFDDPALNSNMDIVVVKILLVDKAKHNVSLIRRNTRASLDSVCTWANSLKSENSSGQNHDIAVFLTRLDIGGPAGFAPLATMCTSENSCTINKDEGLTSSFILAHEIAHVLGLSHDGDGLEGNNCTSDGLQGSVMAPTVQSNFNRYYWSECSAAQFHKKRELWTCMADKPSVAEASLPKPNPLPGTKYSLDDQCRQEFGVGFRLCKSMKLPDPCVNLWCAHMNKPLLCKTKKGPPLDGTHCGQRKWCVRGFCERINKRKTISNPIHRNPRHGSWSEWSSYGYCSRTCGTGVQFRSRKCNNPEPANGGNQCKGNGEDFKLCNTQFCPEPRDFRAEQCSNIGRAIQLDPILAQMKWLPFMANNTTHSCKLACQSKKSGETILTEENVIDGTPCQYDGAANICIQGHCQSVGCDGRLESKFQSNACGVCNGNQTHCKTVEKKYSRIPSKRFTRVAVIPKRARHVMIQKIKGAPNFIVLQSRKFREFILNGGKNQESSKSFIAHGSQFHYVNDHEAGSETISSIGPIMDEITVLISVIRWKSPVRVITNYTIPYNKSLDSVLGGSDHYVWKVTGWSKCSSVCGRGIQLLKTSCRDNRTGKDVSKRHCSLLEKPTVRKRACNTTACQYKWDAGPWEHCSHSCGQKGLQERVVHCVIIANTSETVIVAPNLCQGKKPAEIQPCNVMPCPASWDVGPWSQCSKTCGQGIRYRKVLCLPPENDVIYDCGEKPHEVESCEEKPCPAEKCIKDQHKFCKEDVLHRYCIIPSFYDKCCESCKIHIYGRERKNNTKPSADPSNP